MINVFYMLKDDNCIEDQIQSITKDGRLQITNQ